ncbi:MAG: hypothetical protein V3S83_02750, partial [Gemmatimonadota bacterium]
LLPPRLTPGVCTSNLRLISVGLPTSEAARRGLAAPGWRRRSDWLRQVELYADMLVRLRPAQRIHEQFAGHDCQGPDVGRGRGNQRCSDGVGEEFLASRGPGPERVATVLGDLLVGPVLMPVVVL